MKANYRITKKGGKFLAQFKNSTTGRWNTIQSHRNEEDLIFTIESHMRLSQYYRNSVGGVILDKGYYEIDLDKGTRTFIPPKK